MYSDILLFDTMQIRAKLVYFMTKLLENKLFVDLGELYINFTTLEEVNELVTHALVS